MKNFVKYLLIISVLLTPLQVTADEYSENKQEAKTIQLTDYRYENGIRLTGGYTLLNYYEPIKFVPPEPFSTRTPNDEPPLPSTVIKPDGTELFKPGNIYLNYEFISQTTEKGGGPSVYIFPQNATQDRYIVNNIDTGKYGIMTDEGYIITDCIYDDISLFSDYLFEAQKDKINEDDYSIINSETGKEIFTYKKKYNISLYLNNDNTKIMCCSYTDDGSGLDISR